MKIDKLKEIVLVLIAFTLIAFLIRYLNIIKYIKIILNILIPVFIGFIYSWLFNPLIKNLSKKYNRNLVCIILFLLFILIFGLFIYYVVPLIYREIMEFIKILPDYFLSIEEGINNLGLRDYLDKLFSFIVDNVPKYFVNVVSSTFKYVGVIVIGLILGLYMSMDYEKIVKCFYDIVPKKYKCVVINLSQEVSGEVRKCVNGTLLVAGFVFLLDSICFYLLGLDSFILLGMVCGITDLIPYVGPYIGGFVAVLVGFTESRLLGILTIIGCVLVQTIENYVLQPIVMSKSIKISPVLVIIGLFVFGNLFGVIGMVFATPVLAILKVILAYIKPVIKRCSRGKFDLKNR